MLKQSFNLESISKIIRKRDVWKWSLWKNKCEQDKRLREIEKKIEENQKIINEFSECFHKKKRLIKQVISKMLY